jgi:biopolymer transport protein ExbD
MGVKTGGFKRKSKVASEIPTASMADIAFLLLIFFMVSTTFRREQSRPVEFPTAEATQKSDEKRKDILHLPIYRESDRRLVVAIRGDREVPYRYINSVTESLREANAVRVFFHTDLESRLTRERR